MITVYTAVFGGYDRLYHVQGDEDVEYVAFTDRPHLKAGWTCFTPPATEPNARRESRKYKICSHQWFPESEWTIYLDGNLRLNITPIEIINLCIIANIEASLFLFRHNTRDCLYDEAKECIRSNLDIPQTILLQVERYKSEGYPTHNGLYWGGVVVRRAGCELFNEYWWSEIKNGSCRDQISLPYVLAKSKTKIGILPGGTPFHDGTSLLVNQVGHESSIESCKQI